MLESKMKRWLSKCVFCGLSPLSSRINIPNHLYQEASEFEKKAQIFPTLLGGVCLLAQDLTGRG